MVLLFKMDEKSIFQKNKNFKGCMKSAGLDLYVFISCSLDLKYFKPQAESLLFAAVLLLLQPIEIEEVDRVLQSVGLSKSFL